MHIWGQSKNVHPVQREPVYVSSKLETDMTDPNLKA